MWQNTTFLNAASKKFERGIDIFGMINSLQPSSKSTLLKNLNSYNCSSAKFVINSFLSLTSCSLGALSGYLFFKTANQKFKIPAAASGFAAFN
jgi:hypothetical protein